MLLLNGDCIEQMQKLIDDGVQVDSVVTDPPYHLASIVKRFGKEGSAPAQYGTDGAFKRAATGFMGKEWDGGDIAFRPETWELALKLLKPGGHILAFSASRNYHRMAVAIEDAGFEIRDQMMWLYGSGFPKSLNIGDGWGTALKPAHEPIVMARKFIEGTNKQNKEKYGTGGLNIDGCRIETNPEVDDMHRVVDRKPRNDDKVWTNKNSGFKNENNIYTGVREEGRFPANVMHGGLDTEWSRYFYCPKTSKAEKNKGLDSFEAKPMAWGNQAKAELKRGNLDWKGNQGDGTKHNKVSMRVNTHPTVKPQELMKYLCRMVTPKGGTVLDPFMGSGSTGCAAKDEGFNFIGIEKEKEYFDIADARIKVTSPLSEFMG
jgi:site-specific DNA-methyltransferase (adenine-specific)|tara:strand:+ start:523 stop:1647 length:1125 start_codon:yes stop_codon:yes gene_type:complete